jgi:hypothetical protein
MPDECGSLLALAPTPFDTNDRYPRPVVRGLDPRTHLLRKKVLPKRMDCRVKPGQARQ